MVYVFSTRAAFARLFSRICSAVNPDPQILQRQ
jgi:hypothetical protein